MLGEYIKIHCLADLYLVLYIYIYVWRIRVPVIAGSCNIDKHVTLTKVCMYLWLNCTYVYVCLESLGQMLLGGLGWTHLQRTTFVLAVPSVHLPINAYVS